mgnify:CR=1 FL=1
MCSMKGELRVRERAYADPVLDTLVELNGTVDQREQRVALPRPTFSPGWMCVPC